MNFHGSFEKAHSAGDFGNYLFCLNVKISWSCYSDNETEHQSCGDACQKLINNLEYVSIM